MDSASQKVSSIMYVVIGFAAVDARIRHSGVSFASSEVDKFNREPLVLG
jgi:uncharacterized membrane protein YuzA (DUF378 family)